MKHKLPIFVAVLCGLIFSGLILNHFARKHMNYPFFYSSTSPTLFDENGLPVLKETESAEEVELLLQSAGTAEQLNQELIRNESRDLSSDLAEIDSEATWLSKFENEILEEIEKSFSDFENDSDINPDLVLDDETIWKKEIDLALKRSLKDLWELKEE